MKDRKKCGGGALKLGMNERKEYTLAIGHTLGKKEDGKDTITHWIDIQYSTYTRKKGKEYAQDGMEEQQTETARKGLREDKWNTQERKEGITQSTQERLEGKQKYYAGKEGVRIYSAHRKDGGNGGRTKILCQKG